ncbi:MAG: efflux RND transporter periplasmic adaptor subunit [Bacteroidaceae bacterium]|nr:efflux RND transporter periplasmic adaptor subunit [Bacteroidaceae bacterium]
MKLTNYVSLFLLLLTVGCTEKKEEKARVVPVKTETMVKNSSSNVKQYIGTIEESNAALLSFQVMGNVERVLVDEGDVVKKGNVIARLDRANLEQAHAAAAAILYQAKDGYDRMKKLYESKSIAAIRWIDVETSYKKAVAAEKVAKRNLEDAVLRAPFNGIIGKKFIEVGENVVIGQRAFTLLQIKSVNVLISVPENEITSLNTQQATVRVGALQQQEFVGVISRKGIVANRLSHMYEAKIALANPDLKLLPGMVCNVTVALTPELNAYVLPNRAVQLNYDGSHFVWVVVNNRAKRLPVEVGDLTEDGLLITKGLQDGDHVIVKGYQKVSENMQVEVL